MMPSGRGSKKKKRTAPRRRSRRATPPEGALTPTDIRPRDLQVSALRECVELARGFPSNRSEALAYDGRHLDVLREISERHGFEFLGAGSTRFAVKTDCGSVAKLAWQPFGLLQNLYGAALWISSPLSVQRHLCPALEYTSFGALLQQFADPISPRNTSSEEFRSFELKVTNGKAAIAHLDEINVLQEACDGPQRTIWDVRLDNYGRMPDGRLVAIDYGHTPPFEIASGWVLRRSKSKNLALTAPTCSRFRADLDKASTDDKALGLFGFDATIGDLTERAGWPDFADPCICGKGRPYGECHASSGLRGVSAGVV